VPFVDWSAATRILVLLNRGGKCVSESMNKPSSYSSSSVAEEISNDPLGEVLADNDGEGREDRIQW
jgi:hypothetical protein